MLHLIHRIERRHRQRADLSRHLVGPLLVSAVLLALGAGTLLSRQASAQDAPPPETVAPSTPDYARIAQSVLDAMDAGDFAAVHARFDEPMAAAVGVEQLRQLWTGLPAQVGTLKSRGEPVSALKDGTPVVTIALAYEKATINALFAFGNDGRIAGLLLRPADTAPPAPDIPADARYRETEIQVGDAAKPLPATLAMPNVQEKSGKRLVPAVVLVHGSGPQNRDETIGANRPFLDIARGLAERGIAVLRYEKRTKVRPQDYVEGVTIDNETTDDAVLAVAAVRAQPGIDPKRVFVLGHSQGGMMAPRIAKRDPGIAGMILLAAPSRPLLDILIEQNRRLAILNDGKIDDNENLAIMRLTDAVKAIRSGKEIARAQAPLGLPTTYWQTVEAVDPVAEAVAIPQPMLILQGARDIQVVDADWQRWKDAFFNDPRATFKLYESLNHLAIPGEGDGNLTEYQQPGHVAPELVADIAAWIGRTPAKKK